MLRESSIEAIAKKKAKQIHRHTGRLWVRLLLVKFDLQHKCAISVFQQAQSKVTCVPPIPITL